MSTSLYSSLNSWLVLILHIPCSPTGPYILHNIFLSRCTQYFLIHLSHSPCLIPSWFHPHFTYLNFNCCTHICLRLQNNPQQSLILFHHLSIFLNLSRHLISTVLSPLNYLSARERSWTCRNVKLNITYCEQNNVFIPACDNNILKCVKILY